MSVGFDTPDRFGDKLASLDGSVRVLASSIDAAPDAGGINGNWRAEWSKFVRRWELERDSYASWMSKQFLVVANYRLSKFEAAYLWWAADFERKTRQRLPPKQATQRERASDSIFPVEVWWILGAGVAVYALTSAAKR